MPTTGLSIQVGTERSPLLCNPMSLPTDGGSSSSAGDGISPKYNPPLATPRLTRHLPRRVEPVAPSQRRSGLRDSIFNLSVSALGAGILVIPYSFRCTGLLGGLAMLTLVALASLRSLDLLETAARLCEPARYSFEGVAAYHGGVCLERAVQASLAVLLLLGALTTLIVLAANLCLPVLQYACGAGHECWWASHDLVVLLNVLLVLPLCMKQNLHALRHSSMGALLCIAYLFCVVLLRSGQAIRAQGGAAPGTEWGVNVGGQFVYAFAIQALAFCCQFNLLPLFSELRDPTPARMHAIKRTSVAICWFMYAAFGTAAYLAAGPATQADLLTNFPPSDVAVSVGRCLLALSLLMKCPLILQPLRAVLHALFAKRRGAETARRLAFTPHSAAGRGEGRAVAAKKGWRMLLLETCALLGVALVPAELLSNIALIYSIVGAACGSLVCFILPGVIFLNVKDEAVAASWRARAPAVAITLFGVVSAVASLYAVVETVEAAPAH